MLPLCQTSFGVRWNFIFPFSWALTENVIFNTFSCTQMNYNFLTDICIEHTFWSEPALLNWRPAVQWSFPHNGECSLKNVCSLSGRPLSFAWIKHAICFTYFYHLLPLSQISHLIWKSIHRNLGIKRFAAPGTDHCNPVTSAVRSSQLYLKPKKVIQNETLTNRFSLCILGLHEGLGQPRWRREDLGLLDEPLSHSSRRWKAQRNQEGEEA